MNNRRSPKESAQKRGEKNGRKASVRRFAGWLGASFGALILTAVAILLVFGNGIVNRYGKEKVERAFAAAHPGCALRIGNLHYALAANRLVAKSVTLLSTNSTLKVGRIVLTGVRWLCLFRGAPSMANVLAGASLEAADLEMEFPEAHYQLRCALLRASVPRSELIAEGTELRPLGGDERFFAERAFRTPRFHAILPECRVLGLGYAEILRGTSYQARSIRFSHPSFDTLVNRDLPPQPFVKSPLMVQEALASIRQPFRVGSLSITNGHVTYCERLVMGADPAVLTFGEVSLSVEGLSNRGEPAAAIQVRGQGDLMSAGTMNLLMTIPISPTNFSFHYSGTLNAMDLTRLDAFLEIAEHTRVRSGNAKEAAFDIEVTSGRARGRVSAIYQHLEFALLDKETGDDKGAAIRIASFFANEFKFRNANPAEGSGSSKDGAVNYIRKPDEEFQQFAWFALRTGVLDIIRR